MFFLVPASSNKWGFITNDVPVDADGADSVEVGGQMGLEPEVEEKEDDI